MMNKSVNTLLDADEYYGIIRQRVTNEKGSESRINVNGGCQAKDSLKSYLCQ